MVEGRFYHQSFGWFLEDTKLSWRGGFESPVPGLAHVFYRSTTGLHTDTLYVYQPVILDKMFVTMSEVCFWVLAGANF